MLSVERRYVTNLTVAAQRTLAVQMPSGANLRVPHYKSESTLLHVLRAKTLSQ